MTFPDYATHAAREAAREGPICERCDSPVEYTTGEDAPCLCAYCQAIENIVDELYSGKTYSGDQAFNVIDRHFAQFHP